MKRFFEVAAGDAGYDLSKISAVLEMLIRECGAMRAVEKLAELKKQMPVIDDDGVDTVDGA
jgi:hypothetical protein